LLRGLRAQPYDLLLLTAGPEDKARMNTALQAGADDFMVKPLGSAELQARVQTLLRRAYPTRSERELAYGPYHFSPLTSTIRLHGELVRLKQREYDLALLPFRSIGGCCRAST